MLQFIFGKPSSGKTYTVLNKIKELCENDLQSVLIVPEQFTFESERAVLRKLGDKAAQKVTVLSFSRLFDEVARNIGGLNAVTLSDSDKIIFMKRALSSVKDELKLWSRYCDSLSFSKTMLDTIGEFKINSISAYELREAAKISKSQTLSHKLNDLALIYENYDAFLGEKFIDPADKLTKLYFKLSAFEYFRGKTVFIDSFKGFTGQQYKLLERIISQADNVYVTLTNNPENQKDFNIYSNVRFSANRIEKIAEKYNKQILKPLVLEESRFSSSGLSFLEKLMAGESFEKNINDNSITICKASTIFDEALFTARTIRRLVREEGYRYRDFVIIARDAEIYKEAVSAACDMNKVSCFYDNRTQLSAFPLSVAADAATKTIKLSTENILRFHKTGLGTLNTDEISRLENYAYLWNIDGSLWLNEWNMNPKGLTTDDDKKVIESLKEINELRVKAIKPLITFRNSFKGNAANMASALVELFENCNMNSKLISLCERFQNEGNTFSSDALKQSYDEFMRILDSLVNCFGEKTIKTDEFCEALELAVSFSDIGVIPQMLDEVTFGSADRIRPSRPKIAFILGANQGLFPKGIGNNGIFNLSERKNLIEYGLEIADNSIYSSIDEDYLVYCNLCCASDKLFISYHTQSVSGENAEAATFIETISNELSCNFVEEPMDSIDELNLPETIDAAFSEYCRRKRNNAADSITLKSVLEETEIKDKVSFIDDIFAEKPMQISSDNASKLFGKKINMSASKFDTFNRCRFSFFCRYGLRAKKLQPADFDVLQRGTIVHYVLERYINENKDSFDSITADEINTLTDKYINEYLDSVSGFESIKNSRIAFLISRISRSLKDVIAHITAELSQSLFKPKACELKIGENGEIDALKFPFDDGEISLEGSIDRVDEYNGYIRIIDYKTGSKSFKLPDILFGLNLQMLIYLYAVTRGNGLEDKKAAGILYQPSSRDVKDEGLAMNGLISADLDLISAMDSKGNGEFIPKVSLNKDNTISKRSNSFLEKEKFTEIFNHIEGLMRRTGNLILSGDIAVSPLDGRESPACKYCDYSGICKIENKPIDKVEALSNDKVFEKIREARY